MVHLASVLGDCRPALQKEANNMSTILKAWLNKWSLGWFSRCPPLYLAPYANYLIDTDACPCKIGIIIYLSVTY